MTEYEVPSEENDIRMQPWFWGNLSREKSVSLLMKEEHGHYLVRHSSKEGEYTLAVRQLNKVKCIRIHRQGNRYGLLDESCDFPNVVSLVHHLQSRPEVLHDIFPSIDLLQPVFRPAAEDHTESLCQLLTQLVAKNKEWVFCNHLLLQQKRLEKELQQCETAIRSLKVVQSLYEEQMAMHTRLSGIVLEKPAAQTPDSREQALSDNRLTINSRIGKVKTQLILKLTESKKLKATLAMLAEDVQGFQLSASQLKQDLALLLLRAEENSVEKDYVELLLSEDKESDLHRYKPSNWSVNCDKAEAERLLAGRVPGTFLVRPSSKGGLALSFMADVEAELKPLHCLIVRHPSTGCYGFQLDYCIFPTVEELIRKHRIISLQFYNWGLGPVCLTYPLNYNADSDVTSQQHDLYSQIQEGQIHSEC